MVVRLRPIIPKRPIVAPDVVKGQYHLERAQLGEVGA